ncbi:MAG TPA: tetratricopeptide repeat protein [Candidatus Wallbacteria bacterium]|nr:tetratricopeptide repeat protein [Candidatus Wallbacteria bacterium]
MQKKNIILTAIFPCLFFLLAQTQPCNANENGIMDRNRKIQEDTAAAFQTTPFSPFTTPANKQSQSLQTSGTPATEIKKNATVDLLKVRAARNFTEGYQKFKARDFDRAALLLKMSIVDNPDNFMAYYYLSNIYLEKKMYREAEDIINAASKFKMTPAESEKLSNEEGMPQVIAESEILKYKTFAQRNYKDAIKLLTDGKWEEAIKLLDNAIALQPFNDSYMVKLGEIYYDINDVNKAADFFEKTLLLNPANTTALKKLADICFAGGKTEQAKQYYSDLYNLTGNPSYLSKMDKCHVVDKKKSALDKFTVIKRRGNSIFIDAGYKNGFKIGDELRTRMLAYRPYKNPEIKDIRTSKVLGFEKPLMVGEMLLTRIDDEYAEALVTSEQNGGICLGDEIRIKE